MLLLLIKCGLYLNISAAAIEQRRAALVNYEEQIRARAAQEAPAQQPAVGLAAGRGGGAALPRAAMIRPPGGPVIAPPEDDMRLMNPLPLNIRHLAQDLPAWVQVQSVTKVRTQLLHTYVVTLF